MTKNDPRYRCVIHVTPAASFEKRVAFPVHRDPDKDDCCEFAVKGGRKSLRCVITNVVFVEKRRSVTLEMDLVPSFGEDWSEQRIMGILEECGWSKC